MNHLLKEMFETSKPVIAMAHFPPLPGTPLYDPALEIDYMIDRMRQAVRYLLDGGVDAIRFCNTGLLSDPV